MKTDIELRTLAFLAAGGIIYSGPIHAPPFFVEGKGWSAVIRQQFLALGGERIPGFNNACFKWAKKEGLLEAILRFDYPLYVVPTGRWISGRGSYYRLKPELSSLAWEVLKQWKGTS